ncbi:hypothetical protein DPMN_012660 [Dreissena polymorpha]|uniref:Uncharacterized protein n=1 Tax=Dreissena polymorpha TaxID=45954 RepID=A0A9D4N5Y5_DREPO|nr:hypothetical protein DPMN_012660 [Dreissena polymorpha]
MYSVSEEDKLASTEEIVLYWHKKKETITTVSLKRQKKRHIYVQLNNQTTSHLISLKV